MATLGMAIGFREAISRYGFDTAKACLRAHHDAVDPIQSLVREENIDCGFAPRANLTCRLSPPTSTGGHGRGDRGHHGRPPGRGLGHRPARKSTWL